MSRTTKTAPTKKAAVKAAPKKTVRAKAPAKKKTSDTLELTVNDMRALEEMLAPTVRAYAEEEARILKRASQHPKLGLTFVEEMAKKDAAVPKKYRAAFLEAMTGVDVTARAEAVVKRMEKYWGTMLDADTKEDVRGDVAAMYRGDALADD